MLIESKYKKLTKPIDTRVLKNFMEQINVKKTMVINLEFNDKNNSIKYVDYRFQL